MKKKERRWDEEETNKWLIWDRRKSRRGSRLSIFALVVIVLVGRHHRVDFLPYNDNNTTNENQEREREKD